MYHGQVQVHTNLVPVWDSQKSQAYIYYDAEPTGAFADG